MKHWLLFFHDYISYKLDHTITVDGCLKRDENDIFTHAEPTYHSIPPSLTMFLLIIDLLNGIQRMI